MLKPEEREVTEVQGSGLLLGHQGFRVGLATGPQVCQTGAPEPRFYGSNFFPSRASRYAFSIMPFANLRNFLSKSGSLLVNVGRRSSTFTSFCTSSTLTSPFCKACVT